MIKKKYSRILEILLNLMLTKQLMLKYVVEQKLSEKKFHNILEKKERQRLN